MKIKKIFAFSQKTKTVNEKLSEETCQNEFASLTNLDSASMETIVSEITKINVTIPIFFFLNY